MARPVGLFLITVIVVLAAGAPFIAPHAPDTQFHELLNAPPTRVQLRDVEGHWRRPFVQPLHRVSQLEQQYISSGAVIPLAWFTAGHLVQSSVSGAPLLLLGADSMGRDVFSRLLFGARTSIALAALAAVLAVMVGVGVGAIAGYSGALAEDALMRGVDFLLVLPGMYVALLIRTLLPIVLPLWEVFLLLTGIFAVMGFPVVARGVRGIVRAERQRDYVEAARAVGAGPWRVIFCHLIPATLPFLVVQVTVLMPAFVVAEATFSYVGLGFPSPAPTWGTMLQEAGSVRALIDFPWLLSPVAAMFVVVLAVHLVGRDSATSPVQSLPL